MSRPTTNLILEYNFYKTPTLSHKVLPLVLYYFKYFKSKVDLYNKKIIGLFYASYQVPKFNYFDKTDRLNHARITH
jgi:hypothetical protein